ncbi:MAG: hypothetical protein WAV73_04780 [Candidatus Moraniibacteriota bacterium]
MKKEDIPYSCPKCSALAIEIKSTKQLTCPSCEKQPEYFIRVLAGGSFPTDQTDYEKK